MMISAEWKEGDSLDAFIHSFTTAYERLFGFTLPDRDVIADDVRYDRSPWFSIEN